ncbi:MAG: hypothetical protein ACI8ZB_002333 [Desulforhopalus sp.]|jgi:uncharacterized protein YaiL (DUF2058 family)
MGKSFQDQLLALGLVNKQKAKETKKKQHHSKKTQGKTSRNKQVVDENVLLAQQAEEKKKARARKLNAERDAKLKKREEAAQIKQFVEQNRIEKDDKGIAYRFSVAGKIQRIFVPKDVADRLSDGRLGIVVLADQFEVLPRTVVEKITNINKRMVAILNERTGDDMDDPDDPYAEYKIPDDLVW